MKNFKEKATLYLFLIKEAKWIIIVSIIMGLIAGTSATFLIPLIIKIAREGTQNNYLLSLFFFLGLLSARALSVIMSSVLLITLSQNVVMKLRIILSEKIIKLDLPQIERLGEARLLACLTEDIPFIAMAFSEIPSISINIATLVICITYICFISIHLMWSTLLIMVVGLGIYTIFAGKGHEYFKKSRETHDTLYEHFKTLTKGFKEIKINQERRVYFLSNEIGGTCKKDFNYNIRAQKMYALADGLGQLFFFVPVGLALFVFLPLNIVSPENIVVYIFAIIYCIGPVGALVNMIPLMARANVASSRIDQLMRLLDGSNKNTHPDFAIARRDKVKRINKLELNEITYMHEGNNGDSGFSIGPLNLELNAGDIVFLTGGNGSGKSTLVKLIAGLYFPKKGDLKLNGIKVTKNNIEWYYRHFSVIFSDCFLFQNLIGTDEKEISHEARKYLKKFRIDNKTRIHEGKYTSLALSDGERKRIALISTLLEDKDIYVFDEWAANQDFKFKEMFYADILKVLKCRGKIVLVVTHDDQYYKFADHIVRMDYGKIGMRDVPQQ